MRLIKIINDHQQSVLKWPHPDMEKQVSYLFSHFLSGQSVLQDQALSHSGRYLFAVLICIIFN
jgi:hypothetical protein